MSTKIYNMTDTWVDSAIQYTSIRMNTKDINSDVSSLLLDLKRNGLSEFTVNKLGEIVVGSLDIPRVNNLEESITALSAAGLTHVDVIASNVSVLAANTTAPNNALALVYNDPVVVNNDYYYFDNVSDTWSNTGIIPTLVTQITPRKQVDRTFYVTMGGNDDNDGRSIYKPFQTIGAALQAANNLVFTDGEGPCVIIVQPGEYEVAPETEIPPRVCLYGYDARVTKIRMALGEEENNMFLLNSGCKIRGFTFTGLRHESDWIAAPSETNPNSGSLEYGPPKKGYAFAFKPGAYITRSPYIGDCAVLHDLTYQQMSAPQDRNTGNPLVPMTGGNLYADGSVCDPDSPLRSVVVDSFTAVNPNGVGYAIVENAIVQLVSIFTNWSRVGIWAHAGGQATVVNSNATFGDYAFASTGFRYSIQVDGVGKDNIFQCFNVGSYIKENIDDIVSQLVNVRYPTIPNWNTAIASNPEFANLATRDTYTILNETADDLIVGQDKGLIFWTQSLFTTVTYNDYSANSIYVFDASLKPYFTQSFEQIKEELKYRTTLVPEAEVDANTFIDSIFTLAIDVVENPSTYTTIFQSKVEAASHQFSYAGSGVNYNALPYGQRASGIPTDPTTNLYKSKGGVIYATFNTEQGDTYLGEDLRVDFERSTIEGQAFSRGVQNIVLPLIIGIGG